MRQQPSPTWIKQAPDDEFNDTLAAVFNGTGNPATFPNPDPSASAMAGLKNDWDEAFSKQHIGGRLVTENIRLARAVLDGPLHDWADYVDEMAHGDLAILLASGFPLRKQPAPVGILPAPAGLKLRHGKVSGAIVASCARFDHAVIYEWQLATVAAPRSAPRHPVAGGLFHGHAVHSPSIRRGSANGRSPEDFHLPEGIKLPEK